MVRTLYGRRRGRRWIVRRGRRLRGGRRFTRHTWNFRPRRHRFTMRPYRRRRRRHGRRAEVKRFFEENNTYALLDSTNQSSSAVDGHIDNGPERPVGDGESNRDGDRIRLIGVKLEMDFVPIAQTSGTPGGGVPYREIRIMLVKQQGGGTDLPQYYDPSNRELSLAENGDIDTTMEHSLLNRFRIIFSRRIRMPRVTTYHDGTNYVTHYRSVRLSRFFRMHQTVQYDHESGSPNRAQHGGMHLLGVSFNGDVNYTYKMGFYWVG